MLRRLALMSTAPSAWNTLASRLADDSRSADGLQAQRVFLDARDAVVVVEGLQVVVGLAVPARHMHAELALDLPQMPQADIRPVDH